MIPAFSYDEGTASTLAFHPCSTRLHRLENAMNLQKFPRYPLTFGPSPITPLPRLSAHLGGKVELYAKR